VRVRVRVCVGDGQAAEKRKEERITFFAPSSAPILYIGADQGAENVILFPFIYFFFCVYIGADQGAENVRLSDRQ
jgi:hypothetical protein